MGLILPCLCVNVQPCRAVVSACASVFADEIWGEGPEKIVPVCEFCRVVMLMSSMSEAVGVAVEYSSAVYVNAYSTGLDTAVDQITNVVCCHRMVYATANPNAKGPLPYSTVL